MYDTDDNDCNGCPVFEDSGHRNCEGTPYDAWWDYAYHNKMGYGCMARETNKEIDDRYVYLAKAELHYLERIQYKIIAGGYT